MVALSQSSLLTPEEYLEWEKEQEIKHEYIAGEIFAEVLSDSTEAFDRGDKFIDYQSLETLEEYVLINTKLKRIECFRKNEKGLWVLEVYHANCTTFLLQSINFKGYLTEIYEDVIFQE
ncbi:MAG: Uma2 family endonuclease [Crocosphaera sp.]